MMRKQGMVLLGLFLLLDTVLARADDLTFTVPVKVYQLLPEVSRIRVTCEINVRKDGEALIEGGRGMKDLPIDSKTGNFEGKVAIGVNARPGVDPGAINAYRCWLNLIVDAFGGVSILEPGPETPEGSPGGKSHRARYATAKSGALFVPEVFGCREKNAATFGPCFQGRSVPGKE